jgi:hypothetical protein
MRTSTFALCLAVAIGGGQSGKLFKQVIFDGPFPDHPFDKPVCNGNATRITPVQYCKSKNNSQVYEVGICQVICVGGWGKTSCNACEIIQQDANTLVEVLYEPTKVVAPGAQATCDYITKHSTKRQTKIPINQCIPFGAPCKPTTPHCINGSTTIIPAEGL